MSWYSTPAGAAQIERVWASAQLGVADRRTDEREFKVAVIGAAAAGKTGCIRRLCALPRTADHAPTIGIQVLHTHWPVNVPIGASDGVRVLRIAFWEAGAASADRFDYVRSAQMAGADDVLCTLSLCDLDAYEALAARLRAGELPPCILVVTQVEDLQQRQVTLAQVAEMASSHKLPTVVLSTAATADAAHADAPTGDVTALGATDDVCELLSILSRRLLDREHAQ